MATYFARKAGNINAADVWATTPSGVAAAVTFASGDVLVANSFAITINVDTNLGGSGQVRNDTLGGATAGGTFTLNAGVTLTANVLQNNTTGGNTVVLFSASAPSQAWIVGNVTSPVNTSGGNNPISISSSGTLNFTGNATGDMHGTGTGGAIGLASNGTLNFTGNATGGGGALGYAIDNRFAGTVNITGNCYGAVAPAVGNISTGTVTINGQAIGSTTTGGGAGVANLSTGGVTVKRAIGGSYGPGSTGVTAAPGVANSLTGLVSVEEIEFGANGMSPTSGGGIRLKKLGSNVAVFNYCDTAGAKTLVDATQGQMPAASDVRSGVSYASGALVGSCAVPAAGSVALGVPVGSGTGTAILTQANVQSALTAQGLTSARAGNLDNLDATVSSRLAPSGTLATVTTLTNAPASVTASDIWSYATRTTTGGTVDTLTNAPSVPSAATIASQVRTELSVELGRVDAAISTRATPANIPTSDITAIKAKTDALNTTRLGQVATTEIVGNLLAQANS